MKNVGIKNGAIDSVDRELLAALFENARLSIADLARRVGLSPPSVGERIRRLEEAGTLAGYRADINVHKLGLMIGAWLRVRPIPGQMAKVVEIIQNLPEIVECDRITGEDCFIAKAYVPSVEDLAALIDELTPYSMTNTSVIQSSPVKNRIPYVLAQEGEGKT